LLVAPDFKQDLYRGKLFATTITMQSERQTKIEEQLTHLAATFIERESNKTALITVTRAELRERGRKGVLFVSVLPESGEDAALNFLKRKRAELREYIKKQLPIHPLPFLDVEIDKGEKARHTIDALLKE
jgi:ribosome-binding factor A